MRYLLALILIGFTFTKSSYAAQDNFSDIDGKNYYEFLGIPHSASLDEVKSARRRLMMKYHTDRGGDGNLETAKLINAVCDVLSDSGARQRYDRWIGSDAGMSADGPGSREFELKKNADYIVREAGLFRGRYPEAALDQLIAQGRRLVVYVVRYMPTASYTADELFRLFSEFGQRPYEEGRISADAFAMLSGGTLQYLKEEAAYGGQSYRAALQKIQGILATRLQYLQHDPRAHQIWDALWKVIDGKSYYTPTPAPAATSRRDGCESALRTTIRYTRDGVTYEIPISVSVSIGK